MKLNIMGTEYDVIQRTDKENPKLYDANGLTELYSKQIIIRTGYEADLCSFDNIMGFKEKVFRHEVFHALFHECGLDNYSNDETLVDFLALQYPKIQAIMNAGDIVFTEVCLCNNEKD